MTLALVLTLRFCPCRLHWCWKSDWEARVCWALNSFLHLNPKKTEFLLYLLILQIRLHNITTIHLDSLLFAHLSHLNATWVSCYLSFCINVRFSHPIYIVYKSCIYYSLLFAWYALEKLSIDLLLVPLFFLLFTPGLTVVTLFMIFM